MVEIKKFDDVNRVIGNCIGIVLCVKTLTQWLPKALTEIYNEEWQERGIDSFMVREFGGN